MQEHTADLTAADVVALLGLTPLPMEGGMHRQTFADARSTAIYYLLDDTEVSAFHQLPGPEVFHHYAGAAARLVMLHPDGRVEERVLGSDLRAGQRPQVVVPGGSWQALESRGPWSLLGTTMAPGYRDEDFRLARPGDLDAWPAAAADVARLTRRPGPSRTS